MSMGRTEGLFEINLSEELDDYRGRIPNAISAEAARARFMLSKEALPKEITVIDPVDLADYPASGEVTVYVSPMGDDAAEGSKAAPVKTVAEAARRTAGKGGATVILRGGSYSVTEPLLLTGEHSGTAGKPFVLRTEQGECATFTGNTPISTDASLWQIADPAHDPVAARLPAAAQGKVYATRLADQGLSTDAIPPILWKNGGPPSLYVGGKEYTLARYPNRSATIHELLYFTKVYDTGRVYHRDGSDLYWAWVERAEREYGSRDHEIGWHIRLLNNYDNYENIQGHYRPDPTADERAAFIRSWVNTGNIWYYGSTFEGWEFGYYNLALHTEGRTFAHYAEDDTEEKTPLLGSFVPDPEGPYTYRGEKGYYSLKSKNFNHWGAKHSGNSPTGHNNFYLFNAIEALDEPGEWFLDRETGILYVYPLDEEGFLGSTMTTSNKEAFSVIECRGLKNAVIDGITVDGSGEVGMTLEGCQNLVLQHVRVLNTKKENLIIKDCRRTAVIYSDFSQAGTMLIKFEDAAAHFDQRPSLNLLQNNFFHDPKAMRQHALLFAGCRSVVSHNYFRNTCMDNIHSSECVIEYNRFEGGNADVVDGGMYYASGSSVRNNHIRYNLFHMFNATHQAMYFDTQCSGNYCYCNLVSTLGSRTNNHKGWYSSSGAGNVCFGNLMVLRDPWEVARAHSHAGDEDEVVESGSGDHILQGNLTYYYFGNEHAAASNRRYFPVVEGREELYRMDYGPLGKTAVLSQSLAGHWWEGMREGEVKPYLRERDPAIFMRSDPTYIHFLFGTEIVLDALHNSDYRAKYFYLPARPTGKTFTSSAAPAGAELVIPAYAYLDEGYCEVVVESHTVTVPASGEITLTYEEIAAMERIRRAPCYAVIEGNVMLGGDPLVDENMNIIGDTDPRRMIRDHCELEGFLDHEGEWRTRRSYGYYPTKIEEHNFFRYDFNTVVRDARGHDYTLLPAALAEIKQTIPALAFEELASFDQKRTGPTYAFDYEALGPVQV